MNELFGAPMSDILAVVVVALIVCVVIVAVLALRNRLLFRMGLRNIPRRRGQTLLIVVGLMLSTLIISAAFATGDTLSHSLRNTAFEITGPIDHLIVYDTAAGRSVEQRDAVVPQSVADDLADAFADDPDIENFTRVVFDVVSAENVSAGQFEPRVFLLGLDVDEVEALGGIEDKGKAEPGIAYRIVAMKEQQGRLRGIEGLESPLVGRDNEMASLRTAIDELRQGRGQIVSIMGEAGLGKSRRQAGLRHALGAALRDARWRLGQSQTEAAHIIGVDKASAHRWEAEKTAPNNQRIREAVLRYIRKGDSA